MKQRKTTGILQSLDILDKIENGREEFSRELIDLDKTKKKEYVKFWQYIDSCGDKFEESEADKRFAFKSAFGVSSKFSIRKANAMLRQLVDWIDRFSIMKNIVINGFEGIVQADLYQTKEMHKNRDEALNSILDKAPSADDFLKHYINGQAYLRQYLFAAEDKLSSQSQAILDNFKRETFYFFFCHLFKANIEKLTFHRRRDEEIPLVLKQELQHLFALLPTRLTPLINLQVLACKLFLDPSLDAYECFKTAFVDSVDTLNSDKEYILTVLLNSLILFPFIKEKLAEEQFFLYDLAIDKGIFYAEGKITMKKFNNIAYDFHLSGKNKLIAKWISELKMLIKDDNERKNSIGFAECYVLCGKGLFNEVLEKLEEVKPLYPVFMLRKYLLEFICIYETAQTRLDANLSIKEYKERYTKLLAYYHVKKKITQIEKQGYLNFYKVLIAITNSKSTKPELINMIVDMKGVLVEEKWLEKKIAELVK